MLLQCTLCAKQVRINKPTASEAAQLPETINKYKSIASRAAEQPDSVDTGKRRPLLGRDPPEASACAIRLLNRTPYLCVYFRPCPGLGVKPPDVTQNFPAILV